MAKVCRPCLVDWEEHSYSGWVFLLLEAAESIDEQQPRNTVMLRHEASSQKRYNLIVRELLDAMQKDQKVKKLNRAWLRMHTHQNRYDIIPGTCDIDTLYTRYLEIIIHNISV